MIKKRLPCADTAAHFQTPAASYAAGAEERRRKYSISRAITSAFTMRSGEGSLKIKVSRIFNLRRLLRLMRGHKLLEGLRWSAGSDMQMEAV